MTPNLQKQIDDAIENDIDAYIEDRDREPEQAELFEEEN